MNARYSIMVQVSEQTKRQMDFLAAFGYISKRGMIEAGILHIYANHLAHVDQKGNQEELRRLSNLVAEAELEDVMKNRF